MFTYILINVTYVYIFEILRAYTITWDRQNDLRFGLGRLRFGPGIF